MSALENPSSKVGVVGQTCDHAAAAETGSSPAAFIAGGAGGFWIALLALGCLTVTATALRLGRRLRRSQDVAGAEVPATLDHEMAGG